jgi:hypothetical protein
MRGVRWMRDVVITGEEDWYVIMFVYLKKDYNQDGAQTPRRPPSSPRCG